ncbi:MAG: hypothetical protein KME05_08920 [Gloeocapsa sp. UFS-A4-WI-NPMV-4B04]|jgi:hypothetical protein|nr:hypothetical protein [Gloeocapsa sp. UFS-A4-WI-NPMV-4B04]
MNLKINLIIVSSVGLIFLGACRNGTQSTNSTSIPSASPVQTATQNTPSASSENTETTEHPSESKGGQVIESGSYHLEFVSEPETDGTHMDFYLQKGDNHEAIPNAKVIAKVQLPDGTQKSLPLTYDAKGKHYTALLPGKASGKYNVAILSDVSGEKVNGRFTFNR